MVPRRWQPSGPQVTHLNTEPVRRKRTYQVLEIGRSPSASLGNGRNVLRSTLQRKHTSSEGVLSSGRQLQTRFARGSLIHMLWRTVVLPQYGVAYVYPTGPWVRIGRPWMERIDEHAPNGSQRYLPRR